MHRGHVHLINFMKTDYILLMCYGPKTTEKKLNTIKTEKYLQKFTVNAFKGGRVHYKYSGV